MLNPRFTGTFRKEKKLMQKRGRDISKLRKITTMLINEIPLPPEHKNHPLRGNWEGSQECHIQGDWVLIYEIDTAACKIVFQRTGSHSDLF